jgi:hypothetical protein
MLYHRFQRFNRDERGHAIVIGAIGMLAIAIAILSSAAIGNGVYQKIKLQDASDAQAYSLAAKTARTYNFLAYTNRTMVVHHCSAMTFMAWLSHAYYIKYFIGTLLEVASYIPYIGIFFRFIKKAVDLIFDAVKKIVPWMVTATAAFNGALHLAQLLIVNAMGAEVMAQTGSNGAGTLTDSKAKINELQGGLASFVGLYVDGRNFAQYYNMIWDPNKRAGIPGLGAPADQVKLYQENDLSDTTMARYRLLMSNIANSERRKYTAGAENMDPKFISRVWHWDIGIPPMCSRMDKTATASIRNYENQQIKDRIDARDGLSLNLWGFCGPFGIKKGKIFEFGFNFGGSADYKGIKGTFGFKVKLFGEGPEKGPIPIDSTGSNKWYGITGYYLANPGYQNPAKNFFNQPTFAIVGTKDMKGKRQVFEMKSNIVVGNEGTFTKGREGQDKGQLDMTWQGKADNTGMPFDDATGGMMALSASRAVYHRPGDWKEAPNFFNPLWTAQLVPTDSAGIKETQPAGIALLVADPSMVFFRDGFSGPMFNY